MTAQNRITRHESARPSLWEYWLLVVLASLIGALAASGLTALRVPSQWEVSRDIRVGQQEVFPDSFTDPAYVDRVFQTVAEFARSAEVQSSVTSSDPIAVVTADEIRDTELLRVAARHTSDEIAGSALEEAIAATKQIVDRVYGDSVVFTAANQDPEATLVDSPIIAFGIAGFVAGGVAGIGVAWLLANRRKRT